jgi:hypothetical protein
VGRSVRRPAVAGAPYYVCANYFKCRTSFRTNHLAIPAAKLDDALLDAIGNDPLQLDVIEAATERAITEVAPGARQAEVDRLVVRSPR